MLTFTTYHDSAYARRKNGKGYTIEESWEILKEGFRKASVLIRNKIRKGVSYFWIVEPQIKSGYPHIHAGFFTDFTDQEKERLKNHWLKSLKPEITNMDLIFPTVRVIRPGMYHLFGTT